MRFGGCSAAFATGLWPFLATYASWREPQLQSAQSNGRKVEPYLVSEYSTCGGISSKIFRATMPSRSNSRRCWVNILRVIPGIRRCNSEKRRTSSPRCQRISGFHSLPRTETTIRSALAKTAETFGGLHFAFNNAGVEQLPTPLTKQTLEDYRRIIDVNVMGVWLCLKHELPLIERSGGGCIVNTSSVAGLIGMAQLELYIASKHAVLGLTKSAALEYAKSGVRVNAVCPGAVHTDMYDRFVSKDADLAQNIENMHPMGRSGTPEEIASAVLWLCRDATWTTDQALALDGGFTVP